MFNARILGGGTALAQKYKERRQGTKTCFLFRKTSERRSEVE